MADGVRRDSDGWSFPPLLVRISSNWMALARRGGAVSGLGTGCRKLAARPGARDGNAVRASCRLHRVARSQPRGPLTIPALFRRRSDRPLFNRFQLEQVLAHFGQGHLQTYQPLRKRNAGRGGGTTGGNAWFSAQIDGFNAGDRQPSSIVRIRSVPLEGAARCATSGAGGGRASRDRRPSRAAALTAPALG